jgi:putative membrane protein
VKTFAQQMVDDHTKAGSELSSLASAKGVTLPKDPSLTQKAKLKVLSAMDGTRFDKQYAQTIGVAAHEDAVKLFQKASKEAKDPDVKDFATKTLPTLQHHLQMAKDLKTAADGEKSAKASTP